MRGWRSPVRNVFVTPIVCISRLLWQHLLTTLSFNNFARSWTRAGAFHDFTPARLSLVLQESGTNEIAYDGSAENTISRTPHRSLLRAAFEREGEGRKVSETPIVDDSESQGEALHIPNSSVGRRISERHSSLFSDIAIQIEPQYASPFSGSYGSFLSREAQPSPIRSTRLPSDAGTLHDEEREPLVVKQVVESDDGKTVNLIVGRSTLPQTIFNSVNTLIGIGMLSLPLAVKYSGWLLGMAFFSVASVATSYTAKLLAKCLDVDVSLITFADLAYVSFGTRARIATSILFTVELMASCVALVVLFADSLNALTPIWGITEFKFICGCILVPLGFVPLRLLSFTSVLGIICCLWIVVGVLVDGLVRSTSPGSLRDVATTYVFPSDWRTLPLAYGLLMAPWGGHSVFPNIYRDMRHPSKYGKAVNSTYTFTYSLETILAVTGFLMFGEAVRDEITSNIFLTGGYPRWLSYSMIVAIGIIPLTKVPLNARPIYSTVEIYFGLQSRITAEHPDRSRLMYHASRITARAVVTSIFVIVAIVVPSFDRIMALFGSLTCSLICIALPCSFHLKMFGKDLPLRQKILDCILLVTFCILGLAGTVWACMPMSWLGVE